MDQPTPEYLSELSKLAESSPDDAGIAKLQKAGAELAALDEEIYKLEDILAEKKRAKNDIVTRTMPEIFDEAKIDFIGLPEAGVDLVLRPYYHANLSPSDPDAQKAGFDWLEENGHGDLIKATVAVEFSKKEIAKARDLAQVITEYLDDGRAVTVSLGVHWKTLTAFVREQIEQYQAALPLDLLGATVGRVVEIRKRK